jgi:DNA-binding MarR family transcriptional regulator
MSPTSADGSLGSRTKTGRQVEAVMDASRVLVAVIAQSIATADPALTLPQMRVLTIVSRHGPLNLNAVAQSRGVHPSNATRTCNRLVEAELLDRRDNPEDRRNVVLTLTPEGRALWQGVMDHRRRAIEGVVRRLTPQEREQLAAGLTAFARVAEKTFEEEASILGWPH